MSAVTWLVTHRAAAWGVAGLLLLGGVAAAYVVGRGGAPPPPLERGDARIDGLWVSADRPAPSAGSDAADAVLAAARDLPDGDDASLNERNDHNVRVLAAALLASRGDDDLSLIHI